jgi:epoxide hydrolase-like predicted phosphatase
VRFYTAMEERRITNVVFDLGNVLNYCDLDYAIGKLTEHAHVSRESIEAFLATDVIDRFDGGVLTVEGFRDELSHATGWSGDLDELRTIWEDMLSLRESEEMVGLMIRLKSIGYKVYVLSNINPIHRDLAERSFDFMKEAHGIVYSCDIQLIKPDPKIFQHLLETFDLDPAETLFIDDREVNTKAAEELGIRSITHTSYEETMEQLARFISFGSSV